MRLVRSAVQGPVLLTRARAARRVLGAGLIVDAAEARRLLDLIVEYVREVEAEEQAATYQAGALKPPERSRDVIAADVARLLG